MPSYGGAMSGHENAEIFTSAPYRGDPAVGSPAQVRVTDHLRIAKIAVGPYNNNAYLLTCTETGAKLLIDAAAEPDRLLALTAAMEPAGAPLTKVVTTHGHADHWQGLAEVIAQTGAVTYAGRHDAEDIPVATEGVLDHGDTVAFGRIVLDAIHLQGHTEGSIALAYTEPGGRSHIFTGDCLFPGGVGKTWDDPERFDQLLSGVERHIFDLFGDDTAIYPGHGHDTTLGEQRPHLAEWRERGW